MVGDRSLDVPVGEWDRLEVSRTFRLQAAEPLLGVVKLYEYPSNVNLKVPTSNSHRKDQ